MILNKKEDKMKNKFKLLLLSLLAIAFLTSCSDKGDASFDAGTNKITGFVAKGTVLKGSVIAYKEDGITPLSVKTPIKDNGYYELDKLDATYVGKVKLEAFLERYTDEKTKKDVDTSLKLNAFSSIDTVDLEKGHMVNITGVTELSYRILGGDQADLKNIDKQEIEKQNRFISVVVGAGDSDPTKEPLNILVNGMLKQDDTSANRYGAVLSSISAASDIKIAQDSQNNALKVNKAIDDLLINIQKGDLETVEDNIETNMQEANVSIGDDDNTSDFIGVNVLTNGDSTTAIYNVYKKAKESNISITSNLTNKSNVSINSRGDAGSLTVNNVAGIVTLYIKNGLIAFEGSDKYTTSLDVNSTNKKINVKYISAPTLSTSRTVTIYAKTQEFTSEVNTSTATLTNIISFANTNGTTPSSLTTDSFIQAGLTEGTVNSNENGEILSSVSNFIKNSTGTDVDTVKELQTIANIFNYTKSSGDVKNTNIPTIESYKTLGLNSKLNTQNKVNLMNSIIRDLSPNDIDTPEKLKKIAQITSNIVNIGNGNIVLPLDVSTTPTVDDFEKIGITPKTDIEKYREELLEAIFDYGEKKGTTPTPAQIQTLLNNIKTNAKLDPTVPANLLKQIGDGNIANVTATNLNNITGVSGAKPENEEDYKNYIKNNPTLFSSPATPAEVQAMVNKVNDTKDAKTPTDLLTQIGNQNVVNVTATNLNTIPNVSGALPANEQDYKNYIKNNPELFSKPATAAQVQAMINAVNNAQNGTLLSEIGTKPTPNTTNVTAANLNAIDGVSGAQDGNEDAYKAYIKNNPSKFSSPATAEEVQNMINAINAEEENSLLKNIGTFADTNGTTPSDLNLTANKLNAISGVNNANPLNETAYKDYIKNNPNSFSSPATPEEIQNMVNAVNKIAITDAIKKVANGNTVLPIDTLTAPTTTDFEQIGITPTSALETYRNELLAAIKKFGDDANPKGTTPTPAQIQTLLNNIKTNAKLDPTVPANLLKQIGDGNIANVTATNLNNITGVSGAKPENEEDYKNYIKNNPTLFSSPATPAEVQAMVNKVNDTKDAKTPTDLLTQIGNQNVVNVTATNLNTIPNVSGALPANEQDYKNYIKNNPELFSKPATAAQVQAMINAVNNAQNGTLLSEIGTKPTPNTTNVTAENLNAIDGVSGAQDGNEDAYKAYIKNNPSKFSSPATAAEVQNMINAVNAEEENSLLKNIGTFADTNGTTPSDLNLTANKLNAISGVNNANPLNETAYKDYIKNNPNSFSSPATPEEIQNMVNAVNKIAITDAIKKVANGNTVLPIDTLTAPTTTDFEQIGITPTSALETYRNELLAAIKKFGDDANPKGTAPTPAQIQTLLNNIKTNAKLDPTVPANLLKQIGDGNIANVTATNLNNITGVSGAKPENEEDYKNYIKNNPTLFSSPATPAEVQAMVNKVNDTKDAKTPTDLLTQIGNQNVVNVTATNLNTIPNVSGALPANEQDYKNYIKNNPELFSKPATAAQVQAMINAVNNAQNGTLLSEIGTKPTPNTTNVTAENLNAIDGVAGAQDGNEDAYKAYITANPSKFSSPATAAEVQNMINAVNAEEENSLLKNIGTFADTNGTTPSDLNLTANKLNAISGVNNANPLNETAYKEYIKNNPNSFSSPATPEEIQTMVNAVNKIAITDAIKKVANGNTVLPIDTLTAPTTTDFEQIGITPTSALETYRNELLAAIKKFGDDANPKGTAPTPAQIQTLLNNIKTNAKLDPTVPANLLKQIGDGNIANVTATNLNNITGVSGAKPENEEDYKNYIKNNPTLFSSPATPAEVQAMVNKVNATKDAKTPTDLLTQIGNQNVVNVTATNLNTIPNVSGALPANEQDYKNYIKNNPELFSKPATAAQVQAMINAVNNAQNGTLLSEIGTKPTPNTTNVTAENLNAIDGVAGAQDGNEDAYKAYITANPSKFSSPATAAEVQNMINAVNAEEENSLLKNIGTFADTNGTTPSDLNLTANKLNAISGVNNANPLNETAYKEYIKNNPNSFSSPATPEEIQTMVNAVNKIAITDAIKKVANGNTVLPIDTLTAPTTTDFEQIGITPTSALETYRNELLAAIKKFGDDANPKGTAPTPAQIQTLLNNIKTNAKLDPTVPANLLKQIGDGNIANVTATNLNNITGVSGAKPENEEDYKNYIKNNPTLFSSPATPAEVQAMVNKVNATKDAKTPTDLLTQIGNQNVVNVTATNLNTIPNVSGALPANEQDYKNYIKNNPELFSKPATAAQVQAMINAVNNAQNGTLLSEIGTKPTPNTTNVTAENLNAIDGVAGAQDGNEDAYKAYITANPSKFSSPATAAEVQNMINAVNAEEENSLLKNIGTFADTNGTTPSDLNLTANKLNAISGVNNANPLNETAYEEYIKNNPNSFSSPATPAEVQAMVNTVNASQTILANIGTDADAGNNNNTSSLTATQLNDINATNGVSGAIVANQAAYKDYIKNNPNSFSSPATPAEVQAMVDTVNASQTILANIGTDADAGNNNNTSSLTATQLNDINATNGVSGAIVANQAVYKDYIKNNPNSFSSPATPAEVQAMVDTVNASQTILANIGTDADAGNNNNTSSLTATQLNDINATNGVSGAIVANQAAYKDYIKNNPNSFSSPATPAEVQAMVNTVNNSINVINNAAQNNDANNTTPTATDYNNTGVTDVNSSQIDNYNSYLNNTTIQKDQVDTKAELQTLINSVNKITSNTDLNQSEFANIGISDINDTQRTSLLNSTISKLDENKTDSFTELNALAAIVNKVQIKATGGTPSPDLNQSELESLGLTGITPSNLSEVLEKFSSAGANGADTIQELQSLIYSLYLSIDLSTAFDTGISNTDNKTKLNSVSFDINVSELSSGSNVKIFRDGTQVADFNKTADTKTITSIVLIENTENNMSAKVNGGDNTGTLLSVSVDTIAATITDVNITSSATHNSNTTYINGEDINVTVAFDDNVTVTGTPKLTLNIGGVDINASYVDGNNTKNLVFTYTISSTTLNDTNGTSIDANSLHLDGGTIKDDVNNNATLTFASVTDNANAKVDAVVPTVSSREFTSSAKTYVSGDDINVTYTFSENVTVTGTPQTTIKVGTNDKTATYVSGSGTTALVFKYTVVAGDEDTDGIEIEANKLELNSGTIKDSATNDANLTHTALATDSTRKVDAVIPTVSNTEFTSSAKTYVSGDDINVTYTFSENVTVTGTPQTTIKVGTNDKTATYVSGSGTTALVFKYTVVAGDEDTDGIEIEANKLELNSGTIKDSATNDANLTHTALAMDSTRKVDAVIPTVSNTEFTSSAKTYVSGDDINVTYTFSENVTVTGTPQTTIKVGTNDKTATYVSGSGTTALVFKYTVVAGDEDTDGIEIEANKLELNSGTIKDSATNDANLTHTALAMDSTRKVDAVIPTVSNTEFTSSAKTYVSGDDINVTYTFSENVTVTGTPQTTIKVGTNDKTATYVSGSGTTALVFKYTVVAGDEDTDGIEIEANKLELNSGTIKDSATNDANLTHTALAMDSTRKVDAVIPTVSNTEFTSSAKTYVSGDDINVTYTFSENVTVTGTPQTTIKVGTNDKTATYVSGSGTTALVFKYTVVAGDEDTDGIEIEANKLELNSGTIKDSATNDANLTHTALAMDSTRKVDAVIPTVSNTEFTSSAKTYVSGDDINVTYTFSENVTVTGTPQTTIKVGTNDKTATYVSGSGTTALVFKYTVVAGDEDTDGIEIEANKLELNSGTIKDSATNDANLTHTALAMDSTRKVDAVIPTVSNTEFTSSAKTYVSGDDINVTYTFSENVTVTGTPQTTIKVGTNDKTATYVSGSGTTALVFKYTVVAGDEDTDGIEIEANKLELNSGTIKDSATNDANLTHTALAMDSTRKVDAVIPTVSNTEFTSSAKTYVSGDDINVTYTFSENVTVTGTPQTTIKVGTNDKTATYVSGSGTTALVFKYTVVAGDEDTDGIEIEANKLELNSGTIKDSATNDANLTHTALAMDSTRKVDAVIPTVSNTEFTSSAKTYVSGDDINVTYTFSENVTVTGTPQTTIKVGTNDKTATYVSGSGTTALVFKYTVVAGDEDTDGIEIEANKLELNSGTIKDSATNDANLTHTALAMDSTRKVDAVIPTVSNTEFTSSAKTYVSGDDINVTYTFSENVTVTGTPQTTIKVGTNDKTATYVSGSGTTALVFKYTVVAGDEDTDGIEIEANKLELNSGTIKDSATNDANLTHTALAMDSTRKVDAVIPTVSNTEFTSSAKTYVSGDDINVTYTFSENVTVTGTPQTTIKVGANDKTATYVSGSGTTALVFKYTVVAGDEDTDGIEIEANKLELNSGTIKDSATNDANLTHTALAMDSTRKVDAVIPTVSNTEFTSSAKTYVSGDDINVTYTFSENVTVTGTPQTTIKVGTNDKTATYVSGSGTTALVFKYTVVAGDEDTDGIEIEANKLELNSGTIKDSATNDANLTHTALAMDSTRKVDAVIPTVSNTEFTSSAKTYVSGDDINVTYTFSENVTVTGTPQTTIKVGTNDKTATYVSGSGTTALVFKYTVVAGDEDTDGIEIEANKLELNSGTIKDSATNDANLTHTALAMDSTRKVDAVIPTVSNTEFTSSAKTYVSGDDINVTYTFSENVTVTGTPQTTIKVGTNDKTATYVSGSGTTALVFKYTVVAGDEDTDGIEIEANKLELNSGTIKDSATNDANLTHTALAMDSTRKVDAVIPTVSNTEFTSSAKTYVSGDDINVTYTFSENVTVTGTPQTTIKVGTNDKTATYVSGSGTTALVFKYTVVAGDEDTDGIEIEANKLELNSGTIKDSATNDANLTHTALAMDATRKVDAVIPTVSNTEFTSSAKTYVSGDDINVTYTFSENVTVTGTPQTTIKVGTNDKTATYVSGSGTTALVFKYTVVAGDEDTDGIEIEANKLELNSGTIKDSATNDANLTHTALAMDSTRKVDAVIPTVSNTEFTSSAKTYVSGDDINVTYTFSENVTVTGTPQTTIKVGTNDKTATYVSGSGTTALVFKYTVVAGDEDTDGIEIEANKLELNSGTIKDSATNDANLTHTALAMDSTRKVDAVIPTVSNTEFTSSAKTYVSGDDINVTYTFSENVTVTGTPQTTIKVGTNDKTATYVSGSGTTALVFKYTVVAGDEDTDGIEIEANKLELNSGTIKDSATNDANLTHTALAMDSTRKVDAVIPTVSNTEFTSSAKTYVSGDDINVTYTFSENVTVTGTPQTTIKVGTNDKTATYVSGSGTTALVFKYTVVAGDEDTDGIEIEANKLELNSGTIKDSATNDANLTHTALAMDSTRKVDAVIPTVSNTEFTSSAKTYVSGDDINVTYTFSENVTVTGTPQTTIKVGTNDKTATYVSGSGTTALVFKYTVVAGDEDTDGIEIEANKLELNSGTIKDSATNDANLTHTALAMDSTRKVDAVIPTVSNTEFTSSAKTYVSGDDINVTYTFSENVTVTGTPQTTIKVGTNDKTATYVSGSGTTALVFKYTVVAGDEDTDGIEIEANKLELNSGTIKDSATNDANLTHTALAMDSTRKVDAVIPTVSNTEFTSSAKTYVSGDDINVTYTFSENVTVTGTPQTTIKVGTNDKTATYVSGSGTTALVFKYTVVAGDEDTDGIEIEANKLELNSGTIKDSATNDANLTHTALAMDSTRKVDAVIPTVSNTEFTSSAKTYVSGDDINVTYTFSENVTVTGTPQTTIKVGTNDKTATYVSGSGTTALVFKYTVVAGDEDTDGIEIEANKLELNSGTIKDSATNDANLTHTALAMDSTRKVDAVIPTVSNTEFTSSAKTYVSGDDINVTYTFSENVTVTGTPQTTIKVGTNDKTATYVSGSGTTALVFKYTVVAGDEDTDGIEIEANKLELNSGTIKDSATNDANLTHTALAMDSTRKVDAVIPTVSNTEFTSSAKTYVSGDDINVTYTFSENVTVTGTPQTTIKVGTNDKTATYVSGSGTTALVFKYTVVAGDEDTDGIEIEANKLELNSGTIKDSATNDANLTHTALAMDSTRKVDAVVPTVSTYTPLDGATGVDATANLSMLFNENVNIVAGKNFKIFKTSGNVEHTNFNVNVSQVTGTGTSTITVNPNNHLVYGAAHYVKIDVGAFKDNVDHNYSGISDTTTWNFDTNATGGPCGCAQLDNCDLPTNLQ
jgi:hypothetical protein